MVDGKSAVMPLTNCYLFVCLSGCLHRRKETKVSHNFKDSALAKRLYNVDVDVGTSLSTRIRAAVFQSSTQ